MALAGEHPWLGTATLARAAILMAVHRGKGRSRGSTKRARDVPYLIDENIRVGSGIVEAVEGEVVRNVLLSLDLDQREDACKLVAVERGMLNAQDAGEAGHSRGHSALVRQLQREIFQGDVDDVLEGEGEGIVPRTMGDDSNCARANNERARMEHGQLLLLALEDNENCAHSRPSEADDSRAKPLLENASEPRKEVGARR